MMEKQFARFLGYITKNWLAEDQDFLLFEDSSASHLKALSLDIAFFTRQVCCVYGLSNWFWRVEPPTASQTL